ncbi:hypothetical protein [Streptomyces acidiscabies]|uniref:Uncharacterized protein n=1 Tax=Streptomyces acidiscabies TaxID=42234 RepID=A0ABU4LWG0_9ACTN|nr:hypothetical protein [Streptomyces acidiscabies]MDX3020096.1 hypothetical protein [Streptomyces acidiscabies]
MTTNRTRYHVSMNETGLDSGYRIECLGDLDGARAWLEADIENTAEGTKNRSEFDACLVKLATVPNAEIVGEHRIDAYLFWVRAVEDCGCPERLRDDRSYAIQWGTDDGQWHGSIVSSAMSGRDEVDAYVADVQALAAPGVTVRAVEIRLTHTVLPAHTTAKPADVDHGPVAARTLRSGCRINLFDTDRLIYRVEYLHAGNYLRLHTVPPTGEHPGYFVFTKSPHDLVELISRGPAVDITGEPAVDAS